MKNHRADDKEKVYRYDARKPDNQFCPVRSFEKYLSKLHPVCNKKILKIPKGKYTFGKNRWNCLWRTLMSGIAILQSVVTCWQNSWTNWAFYVVSLRFMQIILTVQQFCLNTTILRMLKLCRAIKVYLVW